MDIILPLFCLKFTKFTKKRLFYLWLEDYLPFNCASTLIFDSKITKTIKAKTCSTIMIS